MLDDLIDIKENTDQILNQAKVCMTLEKQTAYSPVIW